MNPFSLHTDCRHVRWDRPCAPHKARGKVCSTCDEYDPVRNRVLVVKLDAVGDVLRTTSLLPAIHAAFPKAHVTWLTRPAAVPLFGGNGLVDETLATDDAATFARLHTQEWDAVLCPDADPDAAALAAATRARQRRGFTRDERGHVVPLGPGAQRWFELGLSDAAKKANTRTYQFLVAEALGLDPAAVKEPILQPSRAEAESAARFRAGLGFAGPLVGLVTGAGDRWEFKQWTLEHQRTFLRLATGAGLGVLLLGGPAETTRHRELLALADGLPVFDAGTDNSFGGFAARVERCAVVVTGDTFAVHVAAARKTPAVVLFGPTSSAEIELYGRGEKLLPPGLECTCCYLPTCDVRPHCQARILPEAVLAAVQKFAAAVPQ